jgi:hypothetical protein
VFAHDAWRRRGKNARQADDQAQDECLRPKFKAIFGAIFSKSVKWFEMEKYLLLGVNAKWGLLVIFGEFGKICPSAFIQGFMQKVKEVFSKILYWPRANLHTFNTKS